MSTERHEIKNRLGLKVVLRVDTPEKPTNLAFIAHGQGGYMGQTHIEAFRDVFLQHGYRVVRFDATHSIGESDGDIRDVTYDSYIGDLEDIINWARTQEWFQVPFALSGHSMGAQSCSWYAEHHPEEVLCLAPMSPVINYDLRLSAMDPEFRRNWQETGCIEFKSRSKPGVVKQIGWGTNESLKKFDLLPLAHSLTMPVIDVVGELDKTCPAAHQQVFIDAIAHKNAQLTIVPGVDHNYRNAKTYEYGGGLTKVKEALSNWLDSVNKTNETNRTAT